MNIEILSPAEEEITAALNYYKTLSPKIVRLFFNDFTDCVERIKQSPTAWTPLTKTLRRCIFRKFEHSIIYKTTPDKIIIVCIMHNKQKPNYWITRV